MAAQIHSLLFLMISLFVHSTAHGAPAQEAQTFGNAEIALVSKITADFTLVCDIQDFPPVVGQNMPVRIRGLESPQSVTSPDLHRFLKDLFTGSPNDPNRVILLKNIQRGESFCLIADIGIDGKDLGDYLVRKGLVNRILKIPGTGEETPSDTVPSSASSAVPPSRTSTPAPAKNSTRPTPPATAHPQGYVSSKSSKVFHRTDCPHAKRISEDKKVYFVTRQQAIDSGRRPCKTCKP